MNCTDAYLLEVQNFAYLLIELEEVSVDLIFKYRKITLQLIPVIIPSLVISASLPLVLSSRFLAKQLNEISPRTVLFTIYCLLVRY